MNNEDKVRKVAEHLDEILNEDYCMIAELNELCEVCGKPFKEGQEVTFQNEGIAKLIDDLDGKCFVIDNKADTSFMMVAHKACK